MPHPDLLTTDPPGVHRAPADDRPSWQDLLTGGPWPAWLARIALADQAGREVLTLAAESARSCCVPEGRTALLAQLEAAGAFVEDGACAESSTLRPDVRDAMLADLRSTDPDLDACRREMLAAGLARRFPALAVQLAGWAAEEHDWVALETLWCTYSPGLLLANAVVRAAYAEAPPEQRAVHPGLSYGAALSSAFDPVTGRLDLDVMLSAMIRDGRALHSHWETAEGADAKVAAGTLWMLAQATIPESVGDVRLDGATRTYSALLQVIRQPPPHGAAVGAKYLSFFHSTASLVAFLRADWTRARREAELAMLLAESCGFAGFLAALVLALSSSASGNTQAFATSERYLARHAEHQCRVANWIEPVFHLAWADAALRRLDRRLADRALRLHDAEGATRWFNLRPMHAHLAATYGLLWEEPSRVLARFDAILADSGEDVQHGPWGPLLLRARAEILIGIGELNRAAQVVDELLTRDDPALSTVPAARLLLSAGRYAEAVATADEGIFSLEPSLGDRAHLYAIKAAALSLLGAPSGDVAAAATAACEVGAQADTVVPFALLPSEVRGRLVESHSAHHGEPDCPVEAARRREALTTLRDTCAPRPTLVRLTRREEVLLPLLATSATVQEIADQQYVSVNTVRKQVVALREKFGAATRAELVRRAHDAGLLETGTRRHLA